MLKKLMMAFVVFGFSTTAFAQSDLRVLYMEVDAGNKLISKKNPAYRHIFEETGDFLEERAGMALIGERPFEERRSHRQALKDAQEIDPQAIDAIVMVSVKRLMNRDRGLVKNRLIAQARIIDPYNLEVIDTIKVKSPTAKVRANECGQDCRHHIGKRHVMKILPRFKKQLAKSLNQVDFKAVEVTQNKRKGYTLTLKGFTEREVYFLEDRIANLKSTRDFSSLRSKPNKPAFWLERRKNANKLRDDLSDVLARLDLQARIVETPNMVTLVKIKRDLAWNN